MLLLDQHTTSLVKKKNILISLAVFFALLIILSFPVKYTYDQSCKQNKETAQQTAELHAGVLMTRLDTARNVTEALKWMVIDNNGHINNFESASANMFTDDMTSIQLAPNGVVTLVYPEEGNEEGKIDLLADPKCGPVAYMSIKRCSMTVQGPYDLRQGGRGLVIRTPIFLNDRTNFWGFSVVIIKTPKFFHETVGIMDTLGYNYCLSKEVTPLDKTMTPISCSDVIPDDPVSYSFTWGDCLWKLDIEPKAGWADMNETHMVMGYGLLSAVFITLLVFFMLSINDSRKVLASLIIRDPLTGLLNRYGFDRKVNAYMKYYPKEICAAAMLDIDEFKLVNDRYGHEVGDEVLVQLAKDMREVFGKEAILGRNGGDEFVVFLPHTTPEAADNAFQDFSMKRKSCEFNGKAYGYTTSIGYTLTSHHKKTLRELLHLADIALYSVKLEGKNNYVLYTPQMKKAERSQLGFPIKDITDRLSASILIYKPFASAGVLFMNNEILRLMECDDANDFQSFINGGMSNVIIPEDRDRFLRYIQRDTLSGTTDHAVFRIITKKGNIKTVDDHSHWVESEQDGQVIYAIITEHMELPDETDEKKKE